MDPPFEILRNQIFEEEEEEPPFIKFKGEYPKRKRGRQGENIDQYVARASIRITKIKDILKDAKKIGISVRDR